MSVTDNRPPVTVRRARVAVYAVFTINGFLFASWLARLPAIRDDLDLSPQRLGIVLLAASAGAITALPAAGPLVSRLGSATTIRVMGTLGCIAVLGPAFAPNPWLLALGLFATGLAIGSWDVAMNVEAGEVERRVGYSIMPSFHGAFSLGTVAAAGLAAFLAWAEVARGPHLLAVALLTIVVLWLATTAFIPTEGEHAAVPSDRGFGVAQAWREPRTLAIGLLVMAFALVEGIANDWLAIAVIDSRNAENWVGTAAFAVFVSAMTVGRFAGSWFLDRYGRARVLIATGGFAVAGVLAVVALPGLVGVAVGAVLWGLGGSLGFPVGMSAAGDDPARASMRVSVVASIGYTAFLAGPPLVGFVAENTATVTGLLVAAGAGVLGAIIAPALRQPAPQDQPVPQDQPPVDEQA